MSLDAKRKQAGKLTKIESVLANTDRGFRETQLILINGLDLQLMLTYKPKKKATELSLCKFLKDVCR